MFSVFKVFFTCLVSIRPYLALSPPLHRAIKLEFPAMVTGAQVVNSKREPFSAIPFHDVVHRTTTTCLSSVRRQQLLLLLLLLVVIRWLTTPTSTSSRPAALPGCVVLQPAGRLLSLPTSSGIMHKQCVVELWRHFQYTFGGRLINLSFVQWSMPALITNFINYLLTYSRWPACWASACSGSLPLDLYMFNYCIILLFVLWRIKFSLSLSSTVLKLSQIMTKNWHFCVFEPLLRA